MRDENIIDQKAVGDLLEGYKFHIPPYQRGYRWTQQQVIDLCNDLLEYAIRPRSKYADTKTFYSLQPLVVKYRNENSFDVIDGQQRLTTIYILFRLLMAELAPAYEGLERLNLYSIVYDTRSVDTDFIANLGSVGWEDRLNEWEMDIDIAHIYNAYQYIKTWLKGLNSDEIAPKLLTLLTNKKDTTNPEGNAQFIWYQLAPDKDDIGAFIVENKGKIGLTDTERIRALFLYREDKNNEVEIAQQISIAKDWDEIETTLQDPSFWSFISTSDREEGRISILLQYIYNIDNPKSGDLYRFYEQKFADKGSNVALREWQRILEAYRMVKNWYNDAYLYNLIGLLTREGVSLNDLAEIYYSEDVNTRKQFVSKLNQKVNEKCLPKTEAEANAEKVEPGIKTSGNEKLGFKQGEKFIDFNYNDNLKQIRSLLLFLNICVLNEQIEKRRAKEEEYGGNEYRFAFELFKSEKWDVEHIDSATTNKLTSPTVQADWIESAEIAIKHYYMKEYSDFAETKHKYESREIDFKTLHDKVIAITGCESDNDDKKNWIGNLTLLNSGINKGYGNSIFAAKCLFINEKINDGAFVPLCTRMVFYKAIPDNENEASRLEWNYQDKLAYHNWMLKKIEHFKQK